MSVRATLGSPRGSAWRPDRAVAANRRGRRRAGPRRTLAPRPAPKSGFRGPEGTSEQTTRVRGRTGLWAWISVWAIWGGLFSLHENRTCRNAADARPSYVRVPRGSPACSDTAALG